MPESVRKITTVAANKETGTLLRKLVSFLCAVYRPTAPRVKDNLAGLLADTVIYLIHTSKTVNVSVMASPRVLNMPVERLSHDPTDRSAGLRFPTIGSSVFTRRHFFPSCSTPLSGSSVPNQPAPSMARAGSANTTKANANAPSS